MIESDGELDLDGIDEDEIDSVCNLLMSLNSGQKHCMYSIYSMCYLITFYNYNNACRYNENPINVEKQSDVRRLSFNNIFVY